MDEKECLATMLAADRIMTVDMFAAEYFSNFSDFRLVHVESVFITEIDVFVPQLSRLSLLHDFDGDMMTSRVEVTSPEGERILELLLKSKPITFVTKEITVVYP